MQVALAAQYTPHAKQLALHRSGKRFVVVSAGIRGGKTLSATIEFLRRIFLDLAAGKGKAPAGTGRRRQPRLLYWVVAPTSDMGVHVHRYIHQFCPPELIERTYEDAIWLKPGILIEFKTAERPERLVGASVNGVLVDEACRCKPETWRGSLRGRLADTQGFAIFASSPLGGKANWLYQELVSQDGVDPHVAAFSWHTADNPFIPSEEVAHAKATQPDAWFRRDWLADWQSFGGAIYEGFTDANIVNEAQFRLEYGIGQGNGADVWRRIFRRVIVGVDWGFSAPGAMIAIGQLGDNDFVVLEESIAPGRAITGPGTTWVSEAHRFKQKYGASLFACDPARSDAINDFQTNGISSVGAFNDIYLGIRRVAEAIHVADGRPGLRIFSSCQTLIGELRSYMWKATRDGGTFTESPADGQSDHGADALRYGIAELRPYANPKKAPGYGGNARPVF